MIVKTLSPHDRRRLSAQAAVCVATVERAYLGLGIRSTSRARLADAATLLGLPLPPLPVGEGDGQARKSQ
jgi:hypothetical protein